MRIGIPRALLYYRYFPLWLTFFKELGFEVVVSKPSHREIVEEGFRYADEDNCIPIKMAFGHALTLRDRVDFLFVPRLLSLDRKSCFCPRTAGLPEMLRYSIPHLPPILDPYVDERHQGSSLSSSFFEMAKRLGINSKKAKVALKKAIRAYQEFQEKNRRGDLNPELISVKRKEGVSQEGFEKKIAIVGHPYCLYDPFFNFNALRLMEEAGTTILTQEMINPAEIDSEIEKLHKDIYWTFGREIFGAGLHYLHSHQTDGLIYLTCFSCGVDSMIEPLLSHQAKEDGNTLYLCFMVDEHTGAGGMTTRLEAFLETIERRKRFHRTPR
ncbi:MAG: acyl-CoA dehydratase activase-related protein [Thermodesulfobacteriota bacterium]